MPRLHIAALGSSFAAGPGILPQEASSHLLTGRSTKNYAHLLAGKLDADLTDLSVSGASLGNLLDTPQEPLVGWWRRLFYPRTSFPPQTDGLLSDVDIVTITAGGNDLGYSASMVKDSIPLLLRTILPGMRAPRHGPTFVDGEGDRPKVQEVVDRFTAVIDRVREKAPKATICLVDYVQVFGPATRPGPDVNNSLSQAQIDYYRAYGDAVRDAFGLAAEARPGTVLVRASQLSEGHEVGSQEPWVTGCHLATRNLVSLLRGRYSPYHPNAAAHAAIAEELYSIVGGIKDGEGQSHSA